MTLDELVKEVVETEKFYKEYGLSDDPGFTIIVPGYRSGKTCRIAKGLYGENNGHIPDTKTLVFLRCKVVRKYLKDMGIEVPDPVFTQSLQDSLKERGEVYKKLSE